MLRFTPHNPTLRLAALAAVLLAVGLSSGCKRSGQSGDVAHVRLIDTAPGVGDVDAYVNGEKIWKGVEYRSSDGFQDVPSGTYDVSIEGSAIGSGPLLHKSLTFHKDAYYTLWICGSQAGATVRMVEDDGTNNVPSDKAELCVVNATGGDQPIDCVVNNIVAFKDVHNGRQSDTIALSAGDYDVKLFTEDQYDAPLSGPVHLTLDPGHAYTLLASTAPSGSEPEISLYSDR